MRKIKGHSTDSDASRQPPTSSDEFLEAQIQVKCEPLEENQLAEAGSIAHCSYVNNRVSVDPLSSEMHTGFDVQVEMDPPIEPLKQEPQDDAESFPEVPVQYLVPEVQMPTVHAPDKDPAPSAKCFTCKVCEQKFAQPHRLRAHMHKIHKSQFKCEICDAKFTCSSHVKIHMRTHTGEKPFGCKLCDGTFSRVSHLNSHMRTHTGEKPFHCTLCDGKFSHSSTLSAHMRTHTGEKPFSCGTCGSKFTQISNLNKHIRTHTGEKPYNCEVCSIKFTDMTSLKRHRRMHTGEKPFSCPSCDVRFRDSSHLNRHIRIHTGEKPFVCVTCQAKFTQSSNLKTHIKTHHPDVLPNPPPDIGLTESLYNNMDFGEAAGFDLEDLQS